MSIIVGETSVKQPTMAVSEQAYFYSKTTVSFTKAVVKSKLRESSVFRFQWGALAQTCTIINSFRF